MRNRSIDVLRAVAVLLVLVHHFNVWTPLSSVGWSGVDLFFVLSGYLVSGLLFDELKRTNTVHSFRFLLRRGFKIYPSFWLMIALSVIFLPSVSKTALFCELTFLQNYGPGIWVHTWSLAVEEHFYFLLSAAFAYRALFAVLSTRRTRVLAFVSVLLVILVGRTLTVLWVPAQYKFITFGTHVRIDALLFGVGIAWLLRQPDLRMREFVDTHRIAFSTAAVLLVAPAWLLGKEHVFVATLGLTLLYMGFGLVLLLVLGVTVKGPFAAPFALIGRSSYSIYLWHLPVHGLLLKQLGARGILPSALAENLWLAILLSLLIGLVGTPLIENPILRLRDRWVKSGT